MSYLYVNEQGAKIGVEGGYFMVYTTDGMVKKIPKETLEAVVIFGHVHMSSHFIGEVLKRGVKVSIFSTTGRYFGRLESTLFSNAEILKTQIKAMEDEQLKISLTKKIIQAKISNQKVLLRRYGKQLTEIEDYLNTMQRIEESIDRVNETERIIGYEGMAAKVYFQAISATLPEEFQFHGRNRRPPRDPFNSLISLGYTLLMYEIFGEITNRGLSPYIGFLHKDKQNHPTLASDLMEEWRPVIVDSVALSLLRGRELRQSDFQTDEESGGVFLTSAGMKIFLNKYENKLRSDMNYLQPSSMSFRKAFWSQTGDLMNVMKERDASWYHPIRIR